MNRIYRTVLLLVGVVLIGMLLGCATPAAAPQGASQAPQVPENLVARDQAGNWLRLGNAACEQGGWLSRWRKAHLFFQGRDYEACWRANGQVVTVIDSNGDTTDMPAQAFRVESGV